MSMSVKYTFEVTMCKYISVLYVDINKFAIVVVHNGP